MNTEGLESYLDLLEQYASWEEELVERNEAQEKVSTQNQYLIEQLLQSKNPIKLELGAGKERKLPGWTTVDICEDCDLRLNLAEPLPFPDSCVSVIYSSHVLEHFSYPYPLDNLLSECYRILEDGGTFSVCVPNARIYIEAYLNPEKFAYEKYCRYKPGFHFNSKIDYINYIAYMVGHHRYMFDEENLPVILTKTGFKNARIRDFDSTIDLESRKYESIYAIGEK